MFSDRKDAGRKLGAALERFRGSDTLIVGIPRGGVETACHAARWLRVPMTAVIARKLGFPESPETAFGAVAEGGSVYLNAGALPYIGEPSIQSVLVREKKEAQRRVEIFRKSRPLPDMTGKTVILVDDGIATGATLFAAIALCRKRNPARLIAAAPVASPDMVRQLRSLADEVVVLETPADFHAVSQVYGSFPNLTDGEVVTILDEAAKN
jgi:predicted phosphoribosyltransferase